MNQHDLRLQYRFTDRGGNAVYDIKQELLSSGTMRHEEPKWQKVGEVRLTRGGTFHSETWTNRADPPDAPRPGTEGHGTG